MAIKTALKKNSLTYDNDSRLILNKYAVQAARIEYQITRYLGRQGDDYSAIIVTTDLFSV